MLRDRVIRRPALRIDQTTRRPLYLFALTGTEILAIAEVPRLARSAMGALLGYQRAAIKHHIKNIVEYLDSDDALFPNSLTLALSSQVRFHAAKPGRKGFTAVGTIEIPCPVNGDTKPARIIDGQQRTIALSLARRKDFPVPVSGFLVDDLSLQREQFLRINSTKPLPRGLITELLPELTGAVPSYYRTRTVASALCQTLNTDPDSPFCGLIRRPSMTRADRRRAVITDTGLVRMLEHSLASPSGCLFPYWNVGTGHADLAGMVDLLKVYWNGVRKVFPDAWGLPPSSSRLMHSAGIRAMGRLMDRMMSTIDIRSRHAGTIVTSGLSRIRPVCRWTAGSWSALGGHRWNEVQNLPVHIRRLAEFLVITYLDQEDCRP